MTRRVKITLLGPRHTGQGPIARAWGQTTTDVPALQPVIIYEREIFDPFPAIVEAWVLSLHPRFSYMRQAMYMQTDGFIYTFDLLSQPADSLAELRVFVEEIHGLYGKDMPPEVLVGTMMDPTLQPPGDVSTIVDAWRANYPGMEHEVIDLLDREGFRSRVESLFDSLLRRIQPLI